MVRRLHESHPHGDIVAFSHSAPIRAAVLHLTGGELTDFWDDERDMAPHDAAAGRTVDRGGGMGAGDGMRRLTFVSLALLVSTAAWTVQLAIGAEATRASQWC